MTPNGTALVVDDSAVNRLVLVRLWRFWAWT